MIYCMRTRIFFPVNNKDYLLVPNYRIIEFCLHTEYHGLSRIFFFVTNFLFSCHELSNYRIFVFRDSPWFPVWLKINSLIRKFVTKIIPWFSVILRVTIRKFENSLIRDRERLFRDLPWFSVWLKRNNSLIRKFVTRKIIPCEKLPVMHY